HVACGVGSGFEKPRRGAARLKLGFPIRKRAASAGLVPWFFPVGSVHATRAVPWLPLGMTRAQRVMPTQPVVECEARRTSWRSDLRLKNSLGPPVSLRRRSANAWFAL